MRKLFCVLILAGCPPAPGPPAPVTPTPSPSPPAPGTPGGAASPSPSPTEYYKEGPGGDNGDDPLTPGCHYEYGNDPQCKKANEVFYSGDYCTSNTILQEYTALICHPFPPSCRVTHDCEKEFHGTCVTDTSFCGAGKDSAHCEPIQEVFTACPNAECAVKCSTEPKNALCKRGGKGKAEKTNYFCCCCGSTGNTFKLIGGGKFAGTKVRAKGAD